MPLNWTSKETSVFLNPKGKKLLETEARLRSLEKFESHIWLATSGSRKQKFVALSKQGMLESAQAVNKHLAITNKDLWLNPLPIFHVGGLSIFARAHLSGSGVVLYPDVTKQRWNPDRFYQILTQTKATLTSLVPAQVYDLIEKDLTCPDSLRALIVGGGRLSEVLLAKGRALGWPLIPTYGMTECSSQVATGTATDSTLKLLSHIEAATDHSGHLRLKSPALFSAYAYNLDDRLFVEDPKQAGWYETQDLVTIQNNTLHYIGRSDDMIKIGGESVLMTTLEQRLQEMMHAVGIKEGLLLTSAQDDRLGLVIEALAENNLPRDLIEQIVAEFNREVLPFERIRRITWVDSIPRTILGKMVKRVAYDHA